MNSNHSTHVFRAFWPINDQTTPVADLIAVATEDLPSIAARTHAELTGLGRWTVQPSTQVPGSGRVTDTVLVYVAPAAKHVNVECPRCHLEVFALVDDTGVCIDCDSERDELFAPRLIGEVA